MRPATKYVQGGYDGVSLAPRRQGNWHTSLWREKVYETAFIKIINIGNFISFVCGIIP